MPWSAEHLCFRYLQVHRLVKHLHSDGVTKLHVFAVWLNRHLHVPVPCSVDSNLVTVTQDEPFPESRRPCPLTGRDILQLRQLIAVHGIFHRRLHRRPGRDILQVRQITILSILHRGYHHRRISR